MPAFRLCTCSERLNPEGALSAHTHTLSLSASQRAPGRYLRTRSARSPRTLGRSLSSCLTESALSAHASAGSPAGCVRARKPCRHYCLAFDTMGPSLYSALKLARSINETGGSSAANAPSKSGGASSNSRAGAGCYFTLAQIACVASDCFRGLAHMHAIQLTHTDLKPENILFVHPFTKNMALPPSPEVALIDFGGATWSHEHHSSVVCTRQYRPPEVRMLPTPLTGYLALSLSKRDEGSARGGSSLVARAAPPLPTHLPTHLPSSPPSLPSLTHTAMPRGR